MEREQISKMAAAMADKQDILDLLNKIKHDEMIAAGFGDKFYPFSLKHINYYCNPNNSFHRYRQFKIKKKTGGERIITAPRNRSFKLILSYINEIMKSMYTPSAYAMGFTEGRSIADNAKKHRGMNYVFNLDLKDFFPSIEQARVWKRLQLAPFNFPVAIANIIAGMCCMKEVVQAEDGSQTVRYVLPQGAPTSPIITNMICDNLDRRLAGVAKRFGLNYTRYADDITFSSMHNVYHENGEFRKEVRRIIEDQKFTVNDKKTRLQKKGSRQEVTGIIVSDKINVTRDYVRDIRNILYMWEKYGYGVAFAKFFPKYKAEKGHVKKGNPDLINVIDGKLQYLKMVKGEEDSVWQRLYSRFQALAEEARSSQKTTNFGVTYVETIPVLDFEKKNSTVIEFTMSKPYSWEEISEDNPEQKTERSIPAHLYAYFELDGKKIFATMHKSIRDLGTNQNKPELAISSCRDKRDKPFWLIHRIDKVTVPPPKPVDIDELNMELDSLLSL